MQSNSGENDLDMNSKDMCLSAISDKFETQLQQYSKNQSSLGSE